MTPPATIAAAPATASTSSSTRSTASVPPPKTQKSTRIRAYAETFVTSGAISDADTDGRQRVRRRHPHVQREERHLDAEPGDDQQAADQHEARVRVGESRATSAMFSVPVAA
jgi:hypothetical protein